MKNFKTSRTMDLEASTFRNKNLNIGGSSLVRSDSNASSRQRNQRTYSVDTGYAALVSQFYQEKLEEAKSSADSDIREFLKDCVRASAENKGDEEIAKSLNSLKFAARQLLSTSAYDLAQGKFKSILADVALVKKKAMPEESLSVKASRHKRAAFPPLVRLCNKLLLIVASFSRLLTYLTVDGEEMKGFYKMVADEFRKKKFQTAATANKMQATPQPASCKPVVCRICEKKIRADRIKGHTDKCIEIQKIAQECLDINDELKKALEDVRAEMRRDTDDKRATRRLTFIPGFSNASLVDEYLDKCASVLSSREMKTYKRLLRSYYEEANEPSAIKKLATQVKSLFKDESRLGLLKGFIQFMPPDVQVNYFMDEMNKVWEREDAELNSRDEIFEKMKANVENVMSINVRQIDSYERCVHRYHHFQSLMALFSTKSCEGRLKKYMRHLESLIRKKFMKMHEVLDQSMDASLLDPEADIQSIIEDSDADSDEDRGPSIKDFEIVKPISRGSFGSVFLAKKKATGDVYAIKLLKKSGMKTKNEISHVHAERNVLSKANNPFVVKMFYSFQSERNLYMVMEYLNGGDCFSLLRELQCFGEEMAKQYVAETVLALGYLHSIGVVHRDLKPDNMLINSEGHVKLTDFGLSKIGFLAAQEDKDEWSLASAFTAENDEDEPDDETKTHTAVGTPDYIAPEVFLGTGMGTEVDWWALGCILYEFLVGITPFYGETLGEIFNNIVDRNLMWPEDEYLPPAAVDLVEKLLAFEPSERLGHNGVEEVKSHEWFADVDWDTLLEQEAVFVPQTSDVLDTSYFDARQEYYMMDDEDIDDDDEDDDSSLDTMEKREMFSRFRGFSFVNVNHLASANEGAMNQ